MLLLSRLGCVACSVLWALGLCILTQNTQGSMTELHAQGISAIILLCHGVGCVFACILIEVLQEWRWSH